MLPKNHKLKIFLSKPNHLQKHHVTGVDYQCDNIKFSDEVLDEEGRNNYSKRFGKL